MVNRAALGGARKDHAMVIDECVKKMYAGQGLLFGYIDMVCFNLTLDTGNQEPHISDWRNYE